MADFKSFMGWYFGEPVFDDAMSDRDHHKRETGKDGFSEHCHNHCQNRAHRQDRHTPDQMAHVRSGDTCIQQPLSKGISKLDDLKYSCKCESDRVNRQWYKIRYVLA